MWFTLDLSAHSSWQARLPPFGARLNTAQSNEQRIACGQSQMQPVSRSSLFNSRMSLYAYGTDTPSSSATSFTLIKISPAIGKKPSFPDLWLIASPFYPQDSDRQLFSALCRFLFSLARSSHRLLPRRKYPLDGHSILRLLDFTPSLYNGHFSAFVDYPNCKISMN